MNNYYIPELGQALFGQPYKRYGVSAFVTACLRTISDELTVVMENRTQSGYESPFYNTGNSFKNEIFEVVAYSWDEDTEQPWNFRCGDIEISWYKHLGRGMSSNKALTPQEGAEMLDKCLESLAEKEEVVYRPTSIQEVNKISPGE